MKLDIQLFGGRGASSMSTKAKDNVIPRNFTKGYAIAKTDSNAGVKGDRYEITKDEQGFHAKNLRTGESFSTFREHLRNGNYYEFETNNSSTSKANGSLESFRARGVEIKDSVPKGYRKVQNATTAPKGYEWYSNNKDMFGGEYKHVLVKTK